VASIAAEAVTDALKVPPHSVEAEQAVLGGLMLDNDAWLQVTEHISEADFYRNDHRLIFRAIAGLSASGKPSDVVTVAEALEAAGDLERVGGLAYIAALAENTPSAANITAYADIVRTRSILRQLIRAGATISGVAFNPEGRNSDELLDEAERIVFAIAEQRNRGRAGYRPIKELLTGALDRIDELFTKQNPITGIPTGWKDFDELTSGLQPSDLVVIAGRPSMGKTAMVLNIVEHAAIKDRLSVVVFSMEMPGEQLAIRLMSSLGHIDQHRIRTGKLTDDDWPRLTSAVQMLSDTKLFIDDTPALAPGEVRARCRRIAREHGLDMVVLDYLQLMQVAGTKENRATEISEISRAMKALAKELNVPVVALSQLNRSLESRTDKRPVMSDLRESGAIEQDADVIVFIYRDEVYNQDSDQKGIAEIIIAKQRNGPIGTIKLTFRGQFTRFDNLAYGDYQQR
jgi:replicative DNA helicase